MDCQICKLKKGFRELKGFVMCVQCYRLNQHSSTKYKREIPVRAGEFNNKNMSEKTYVDYLKLSTTKPLIFNSS